jgi:MarR family 2-MHQ and catechol resistance regulon transcriptional repressor
MPTISTATRVDAYAFSSALGDLIRVVQFRDRDRACCHDLSVSQCYALSGIIQSGTLSVNEVAAHLFVDKSTASRVVNGLVTRGVVERVPDESDARRVRLRATVKGIATHDAIERELATEYTRLLEQFDPEVASATTDLLRKLAQSFADRVDTSSGRCCALPPTEGVMS